MDARLARWQSRPPPTAAYVMPQFAKQFRHWESAVYMDSPEKLEQQFTTESCELIPDNYLTHIEGLFQHVHMMCTATLEEKPGYRYGNACVRTTTPVLLAEVQAMFRSDNRVITLVQVAVRQCGETFGFCRLLLHELARNCVHFRATLVVKGALSPTKKIVMRAFTTANVQVVSETDLHVAPEHLVNAGRDLGVLSLLLPPQAASRKRRAPEDWVADLGVYLGRLPQHTVFRSNEDLLRFLQGVGWEGEDALTLQYCMQNGRALNARFTAGRGWVVNPLPHHSDPDTLKRLVLDYVSHLVVTETLLVGLTTESLAEAFNGYLEAQRNVARSAFTVGQIQKAFQSLLMQCQTSQDRLHQSVLMYRNRANQLRWQVGARANPMCLNRVEQLIPEFLKQEALPSEPRELLPLFRRYATGLGLPGDELFTDATILKALKAGPMLGLAIAHADKGI
jgi:hypothetical protein